MSQAVSFTTLRYLSDRNLQCEQCGLETISMPVRFSYLPSTTVIDGDRSRKIPRLLWATMRPPQLPFVCSALRSSLPGSAPVGLP